MPQPKDPKDPKKIHLLGEANSEPVKKRSLPQKAANTYNYIQQKFSYGPSMGLRDVIDSAVFGVTPFGIGHVYKWFNCGCPKSNPDNVCNVNPSSLNLKEPIICSAIFLVSIVLAYLRHRTEIKPLIDHIDRLKTYIIQSKTRTIESSTEGQPYSQMNEPVGLEAIQKPRTAYRYSHNIMFYLLMMSLGIIAGILFNITKAIMISQTTSAWDNECFHQSELGLIPIILVGFAWLNSYFGLEQFRQDLSLQEECLITIVKRINTSGLIEAEPQITIGKKILHLFRVDPRRHRLHFPDVLDSVLISVQNYYFFSMMSWIKCDCPSQNLDNHCGVSNDLLNWWALAPSLFIFMFSLTLKELRYRHEISHIISKNDRLIDKLTGYHATIPRDTDNANESGETPTTQSKDVTSRYWNQNRLWTAIGLDRMKSTKETISAFRIIHILMYKIIQVFICYAFANGFMQAYNILDSDNNNPWDGCLAQTEFNIVALLGSASAGFLATDQLEHSHQQLKSTTHILTELVKQKENQTELRSNNIASP